MKKLITLSLLAMSGAVGAQMSSASGVASCPFGHGSSAPESPSTPTAVHANNKPTAVSNTNGNPMPTNRSWWPNQLDLSVLRQHSNLSNPMGANFNYIKAFNALDLEAVKKRFIGSYDYSTRLVASRLWSLRSFIHKNGLAQCGNL